MESEDYNMDELRRAIRDYFTHKPPPDVVPHQPITANDLLALDGIAARGGNVTTHNGGRLRCKVNDVWLDGEEWIHHAAPAVVTAAVLRRAGLQPCDVPHLRVVQ